MTRGLCGFRDILGLLGLSAFTAFLPSRAFRVLGLLKLDCQS